MEKQHFHSLDALRFFAFLKVYLLHLPIQGEFPIFSFIKSGGGIGVSFFFVLSGFLITYLLTFEKKKASQINVKRFFIRRSLRIWPLFYLILIIVYLLPFDFKQISGLHMVGGGYDLDWKYSFFFLENYKMLLLDNVPKTSPLSLFWSLCIEEHFYIFWLVCLSLLSLRHYKKFFIFCCLIAYIARYLEGFIWDNHMVDSTDLWTNLDFFAWGGLLGFLVATEYEKLTNFIQKISAKFKWCALLFILLIVVFQKYTLPYEPGTIFYVFRSSIVAILFTVLIAIFIPQQSNIKIKSKVLSYLGQISYGLYVYHILIIHVSFQYCIDNQIVLDNWLYLSVFIIWTFILSVIISSLSYFYFEKKFLKIRERIVYK